MHVRKKKTVPLVPGSGGVRGLPHIGIIAWIEENRAGKRELDQFRSLV